VNESFPNCLLVRTFFASTRLLETSLSLLAVSSVFLNRLIIGSEVEDEEEAERAVKKLDGPIGLRSTVACRDLF